MAYVRKLPAGTVGWTGSTMHENQQEDVFMPCDTRLVAVNVGPDGTFGTLVYDTNQNNEYDKDRSAWLQSAFRVIKKPQGRANAIGFQLYTSGNKDTKGGFFVDQGDGSTTMPKPPGEGGRPPVATGGSGQAAGGDAGGAGPGGLVHVNVGKPGGVVIGQGSFNDGGPFHVGNKSDKHNKGNDADGNPINSLHLWTSANFYRNSAEDGPLRFESEYKKGEDQKIIVPVHLGWTGADWAWWSTSFFYEPPPPYPPYPPYPTPPTYPNVPTPGTPIRPPVTTPGPVTNPSVATPGPLYPPVATPGHGPGGTWVGPPLAPAGGAIATPGTVATGGGVTTDPPTGGAPTATGGGLGGNTPVTPGTTGGNQGGTATGGGQTPGATSPGPGEGGFFPPDWTGPMTGGVEEPPWDDPSAGPQGGLFGPLDPYAPPKPPNFDLPFDPSKPIFHNIAPSSLGGPTFNMISSVAPLVTQANIFQAANYAPGALDPGLFGAASASGLGKTATTSPLTGGMSSFAAQGGTIASGPPVPTPTPNPPYPPSPPYPTPPPSPAPPSPTPTWPPPNPPPTFPPFPPNPPPTTTGGGGDPWDYTTSPSEQILDDKPKSRYQSGTAVGGICYHPIETDLRDAMSNGMVPEGVELNDFYVVCAPNAYFGVGVPNLVNGTIQSGYRWGVDATNGDLVFSSISYAQTPVEAMRFTNTNQSIQWMNGVYSYGELYHQNTADRRYTFPDSSGKVALFGDAIYPTGSLATIQASFGGSGPANFVVYRWIPWLDTLTNQIVYIPALI